MSDSFIHELPLKYNPADNRILDIRFEMARFLFNAVLKEGLVRIKLLKESKLYQRAKNLKPSKERNKLFKETRNALKFSDYDLQKFAILTKNKCDIKKHLDTHVCQKMATRAYLSLNEYLLNKRGRPRFKRKGWISSVEGKDNRAGIRFKDGYINWRGLRLSPIFDIKDRHLLEAYALRKKTKYTRLVKRKIRGKTLFFAQLIKEGQPFIKNKNTTKNEVVGLDIGPSTIATLSKEKASLRLFCEELTPIHNKIKLYQRKTDRSLRSTNKENYDEKKRVLKNKKLKWKKSNKFKKLQETIAEFHRKSRVYRKRLHGKLANEILALGNKIQTEDISYKWLQKLYGKSVNFRAPSSFIQILRRKAENAGGYLLEFNTITTSLSQTCHSCRRKEKKQLSQRWHDCKCGIRAQRDLYSAFLSIHVKENKLDFCQAEKAWPGAHPLLEQAISSLIQTANRSSLISSFGISKKNEVFKSQSGLLVKERSVLDKIKDVVRVKSESFEESNNLAFRTP